MSKVKDSDGDVLSFHKDDGRIFVCVDNGATNPFNFAGSTFDIDDARQMRRLAKWARKLAEFAEGQVAK